MTWTDSQIQCQKTNNSYLVEIFSNYQQTYLKAKAFEKGVDLHWWIGLTDKIRNGQPFETFS